jgi:hypothetical protein
MGRKKLTELARVIRSKNAGPFELTFDVIFKDAESYERAKESGVFSPELFAELYRSPVEKGLNFCFFDGAQQHAPLLEIEIPWGD